MQLPCTVRAVARPVDRAAVRVLALVVVLAVLAIGVLAAGAGSAAAAAMRWTGTGSVASGAAAPAGLSCPTATQCTTLSGGGAVTFNPASPSPGQPSALGIGAAGEQVACPSATQCTAIGSSSSGARVATFDPQSSAARAWPGPALTAAQLSCPSATVCVAAGAAAAGGSGATAIFDPSGSAAPQYAPGPSLGVPYSGVSCPSAGRCVAVGGGQAVSFDPGSPGAAQPAAIDPGQSITAVSCAQGALECVAVDAAGGAVRFTPGASHGAGRTQVVGHPLTAVSCTAGGIAGGGRGAGAGATCTAVDAAGDVVSLPTAGAGSPTVTPIASGALTALDCVAGASCTALGPGGTELTFNPDAPGRPTPAAVLDTVAVSALSCPATAHCTALYERGSEPPVAASFDPARPSLATVVSLGLSGGAAALDCPTTSRCVAVGGDGQAVAFGVGGAGAAGGRTIAVLGGVTRGALSCPTATQCTVVAGSAEQTFDPATGTASPAQTIDTAAPLTDVSCPASTQCTAGDGAGGIVTFDAAAPQRPVRRASGLPASTAIDCPIVGRCASVAGARAVSFDPNWPGSPKPVTLDRTGTLSALACAHSGRCVAVDSAGSATEFRPSRKPAPKSATLSGAAGVGGVACPAVGRCTFVDSVGHVYAGAEDVAPYLAVGAAPTIRGHFRAGGRLTGIHGRWRGTGKIRYSYRWQRCIKRCRAIAGATHRLYRVRAADRGHIIRLQVTARNAVGATRATSDRYGPILGFAANQAKLRRALRPLLPPHGRPLALLLGRRIVRFRFHAPDIGRIAATWTLRHGGRRTVVARGQARPDAPGAARLKVGLTRAGRRLLRGRTRVTVTAQMRYKVRDGPTVIVRRRIVLRG